MKMQSQALLFGIESSKGNFEGTPFDSTKFHLSVDLGTKSTGKTIGLVTRPFKFGDSTEIESSLPHRQLRKESITMGLLSVRSLPHRQLRNA